MLLAIALVSVLSRSLGAAADWEYAMHTATGDRVGAFSTAETKRLLTTDIAEDTDKEFGAGTAIF